MAKTNKKNANQVKNALLEVAQKLFIEQSYSAVSTREIAQLANQNLGSIQYYFGSKADLFIATIEHMMHSNACFHSNIDLNKKIRSQSEAISCIVNFIWHFLNYILNPQGPQACRLMFREVLAENSQDPEMLKALVASVANNFTQPIQESLIKVLSRINPKLNKAQILLCMHSIIGQCTFYLSHRLFIEFLTKTDLSTDKEFKKIFEHVVKFSLRALEVQQSKISLAIRKFLPS